MAKEYIDREAALEALSNPFTMSMCLSVEECKGMRAARDIDRELIKRIPAAADVVEVRHGHWIRREGFDYENNVILGACSKCDFGVKDFTNYCPNCGVKMDKEARE